MLSGETFQLTLKFSILRDATQNIVSSQIMEPLVILVMVHLITKVLL